MPNARRVMVSGSNVSVVIAVNAHPEYLRETLAAIESQTERPGEVIIVDDASRFDVRSVVQGVRMTIPVRVESLEVNSGVAVARNVGNEMARLDWIAVCDGDDIWLPTKLERQIAFINAWAREEPLVAVGCDAMNVNESGKPYGVFPGNLATWDAYRNHLVNDRPVVMCHSSVLCRRMAVSSCGGYPTEVAITADTELLTNLAASGVVMTIPEVLVRYRKHASSLTMSWKSVRQQHVSLARISANAHLRRLGEPELSPEEFGRVQAARGRLARLGDLKYCTGKYLYRSGAVRLANGRTLSGGCRLALAFPLVPRRVMSGLLRKLQVSRSKDQRPSVAPAAEHEERPQS